MIFSEAVDGHPPANGVDREVKVNEPGPAEVNKGYYFFLYIFTYIYTLS